jgi:hypothetical protein
MSQNQEPQKNGKNNKPELDLDLETIKALVASF